MINTDDFGDFTQNLCCAFFKDKYDIRFVAGDSYRRTQNIELIEQAFGEYLYPKKNVCGPRIIIAERPLTMPDLFMFQPITNDELFFSKKNYFWIESKSSTEPRTLVSIKKRLFSDYLEFNDNSLYNVFVSFMIPTKKYKNDEYWLWDYNIYLQTIDELNRTWFEKEEYLDAVWWRLTSNFKRINSHPINAAEYMRYFHE